MITRIQTAFLLLLLNSPTYAGMPPGLSFTDIGGMRLNAISFFLVVILLVAWGIKGFWIVLRRDFPKLPRISYKGSLAMVLLLGLLFNIVLLMISGTRELMTPDAWERDGVSYRLNSDQHWKTDIVTSNTVSSDTHTKY